MTVAADSIQLHFPITLATSNLLQSKLSLCEDDYSWDPPFCVGRMLQQTGTRGGIGLVESLQTPCMHFNCGALVTIE